MEAPHLASHPVLAAFGFGVMHALTPCAHSWPVLLPLTARARSGGRPGILFGIGMLLSSIAVGAIIGGFGGAVFKDAGSTVEEIVGVVLALLGLGLLVRPGMMHAGHLHGGCQHTAVERPKGIFRFGHATGAFMLGIANMSVPCWSNVAGVTLAVESGSALAGGAVLGVYGFAAAVTTVALLVLVHKGLRLTERLASPRVEAVMLRIAGLLMLLYALSLIFHVGHDHG
jgi:nickel/cobalt exporter